MKPLAGSLNKRSIKFIMTIKIKRRKFTNIRNEIVDIMTDG